MTATTLRFNQWDPEIDARVEEILVQMSLEEESDTTFSFI